MAAAERLCGAAHSRLFWSPLTRRAHSGAGRLEVTFDSMSRVALAFGSYERAAACASTDEPVDVFLRSVGEVFAVFDERCRDHRRCGDELAT